MRVIVLSAAVAALCLPVWAADDVNAAEIIQKFAAKELEFQQARNNYTYRQSVKLEDVDGGGVHPGSEAHGTAGVCSEVTPELHPTHVATATTSNP